MWFGPKANKPEHLCKSADSTQVKPLELKAPMKDSQVGLPIYKTTLLLEEESAAASLAAIPLTQQRESLQTKSGLYSQNKNAFQINLMDLAEPPCTMLLTSVSRKPAASPRFQTNVLPVTQHALSNKACSNELKPFSDRIAIHHR